MGNSHIILLNEVGTNYYDGGGMEGLIRKIYRGDCRTGMLAPYLNEIISNHLYYIPQSRLIHNEFFKYEFYHGIHQLFNMINVKNI